METLFLVEYLLLSSIDMHRNQISQFDVCAGMKNWPVLQHLHLNYNRLTTVCNLTSIPRVGDIATVISIQDNPITCSLATSWLNAHMKSHDMKRSRVVFGRLEILETSDMDRIKCSSPERLKGVSVWKIDPEYFDESKKTVSGGLSVFYNKSLIDFIIFFISTICLT